MRIVIDLQGAQGARRETAAGRNLLDLATALARQRGSHEVLIALSSLFPDAIEPIRAAFHGLIPQEDIRVWHGVGPCNARDAENGWRREVDAQIRETFLAGLRPNVVLVGDILGGYVDDVVITVDQQFPTVVLHHPRPHAELQLACNPGFARHHAAQAQQLSQAAAWLTPAGLPEGAAPEASGGNAMRVERLVEGDWDARATQTLALFQELQRSPSVGHDDAMPPAPLIEAVAAIAAGRASEEALKPVARAMAASFPQPRARQILIDVSAIVQKDARTGIQRVTRSILKELLLDPPPGCIVEPVYATAESDGYFYARHYAAALLSREREGDDDPVEHRAGDVFLGLDLQHGTIINQHDYLMRLRQDGVKVLAVVYDLLPITMPQHFTFDPTLHSRWLETVSDFDGVVCDSRTVADEVQAWLRKHGRQRLRPFEIDWFHQGSDITNSVPTLGVPDSARHVLDRLTHAPSFLTVGTVESRKGHRQTLDAFERLWSQGKDVILVIVGRQGWKVEDVVQRLGKHAELGKRLFWLEGISDEYLEQVYAASTCLIAASEGEGFGLPLVEGARHHLPIIARDLPVFREVAGDHAFYFDGLEPERLAGKIDEWLALHAAGRAPQSSGISWLTWAQSAQQLKEILVGERRYIQWLPDDRTSPVPSPAPAALVPSLAELQAEVAALRQQLTASQAEVAAMKASRSWRITAPLRGMTMLARGRSLPRLPSGKAFPLRDQWYDAEHPEVSLIVLNYNKPAMTLACLESLWEHTQGYRYEIVLVDNGSTPENFRMLAPASAGARLVRVDINRYFGEGNNIGFEASRGRYVVFLNNDITATPGWLEPLVGRLQADDRIGVTGPMLVSPDGQLQEAGASINPDGTDNRYGRGADPADPAYGTQRDVTYVSAAAAAMRREVFEQALGFDLYYEPAYYEDVDLCLKIGQMGLRVVYCPDSRIVHHENATSNEFAAQLKLGSLIPLNRERFLSRWRQVLIGEAGGVPGLVPLLVASPRHRPGRANVLLYTPCNLVPGGGERYLLTIAAGLTEVANVTLATLYPYSRLRLRTMGRELALDLDDVRITTLDCIESESFEISIVMGNEVLPSIPGRAARNLYICQFPFPAPQALLDERRKFAPDYEEVLVYSPFARRHYILALQALGMPLPKVTVVTPPAPSLATGSACAKRPMIVGVGRFFTGGHAKRHDLMIEAFRRIAESHPEAELHLAGSLMPANEFRAYFTELQRAAEGLRVHFHPNVSAEKLAELYANASLYWHLAGYGVDEATDAYRCEHFGITVVEAMSAGCIPLVVDRGGPPQTVEHGVTGYVFESLDELVCLSEHLLDLPQNDPGIVAMRAATIEASAKYRPEHFVAEVRHLLGLPAQGPAETARPEGAQTAAAPAPGGLIEATN